MIVRNARTAADDQAAGERDEVPEPDRGKDSRAKRVAERPAHDDDRRVVPEVAQHGEHDPDDEAADPRGRGREEAIAEQLLDPARARGEADEERPDRQQDQERLEAVERPCQADHDRDDSDEDLFEHAVHPPMQPGQLPAVG